MNRKMKNWFTFLPILLLSIIFLAWTFYSLYFSLKFFWSWKNGFVDFSDIEIPLFRFFLYCVGLILGIIFPLKFLQKLLSKLLYLVIFLSPFFVLAYIFFYNPAIGEPRFYFLGKYENCVEICFGILEDSLLIALGLCLTGFIRRKMRKES